MIIKFLFTRCAKWMAFVPSILEAGAKETDPIRQFQSVISLLTASTNHIMTLKQPINPILGETLNGWLGNCRIYVEQISHHPPVSAYMLDGPGYIVQGTFEAKPSIGAQIYMMIYGESTVTFKESGNKFVFTNPYMRIKGIFSGQRRFIIEGKKFIFCPHKFFEKILT